MICVLKNNLSILNTILKNIKDYISYFWQPTMAYNYRTREDENNGKSKKPKKEIDKTKNLNLNNIMVLKVSNNGNEEYMISMLALKQNNCEERILIKDGSKEKELIEKCLYQNLALERKSILDYISEEEKEMYNQAMNEGNYQYCLSLLRLLEETLNKEKRVVTIQIRMLQINKKR